MTSTKFQLFPSLPTEIQDKIWDIAATSKSNGSVHRLFLKRQKLDHSGQRRSQWVTRFWIRPGGIPSLLHTCHSSRERTMRYIKILPRFEKNELGTRFSFFYANFDIDTFYLCFDRLSNFHRSVCLDMGIWREPCNQCANGFISNAPGVGWRKARNLKFLWDSLPGWKKEIRNVAVDFWLDPSWRLGILEDEKAEEREVEKGRKRREMGGERYPKSEEKESVRRELWLDKEVDCIQEAVECFRKINRGGGKFERVEFVIPKVRNKGEKGDMFGGWWVGDGEKGLVEFEGSEGNLIYKGWAIESVCTEVERRMKGEVSLPKGWYWGQALRWRIPRIGWVASEF